MEANALCSKPKGALIDGVDDKRRLVYTCVSGQSRRQDTGSKAFLKGENYSGRISAGKDTYQCGEQTRGEGNNDILDSRGGCHSGELYHHNWQENTVMQTNTSLPLPLPSLSLGILNHNTNPTSTLLPEIKITNMRQFVNEHNKKMAMRTPIHYTASYAPMKSCSTLHK